MRTLGIDAGERRVGLALSDAGGRIATPLEVVEVASMAQALGPVLGIIEREGVERIVLGLPLNMDGTIGPQAERVRKWGRQLQQECDKPLDFVDERLSTFAADQHLGRRRRQGERLTHKRKKQQRDAVAAAILLQEYLDGALPPLDAIG